MGRELKRVPLNFKYPIKQTWKGYINPYKSIECEACHCSGLNKETNKLSEEWYRYKDGREGWCYHLEQDEVQALLDNNRLWDLTRVPINSEQQKIVDEKIKNGGNSWLPYDNGREITAEIVNIWARKSIFGYDSCNQYICVQTRAKRLGVYGNCPYCNGEGYIYYSEEIKKLNNNWEGYDPPVGGAYQLWQNTSEGSPISPVFMSPEKLCDWASYNATIFGNDKMSVEEWKGFINYPINKPDYKVFMKRDKE